MKIVRTGKRIITNSIQRAITAVLIKVILATGVVSLIVSYAFGQTYEYQIDKSISLVNSAKKYSVDYMLNPNNDWDSLTTNRTSVNIEYSINFTDNVITKKVNGSRVAYSKFTVDTIDLFKSTGSDIVFSGSFVIKYEQDFEEITLAFIDGFQYDMDAYNKTGILYNLPGVSNVTPVFFEYKANDSTSVNLTAYTSYTY